MQSKDGVLIFMAVIALPAIAIAANHNILFVVVAAAVTLVSIRQIYSIVMLDGFSEYEIDEELQEDLEELTDIDIEKFSEGLSVIYNLIVLLFIFYCSFFLDSFPLKAVAALAMLLQAYFIIRKASKSKAFDKNRLKPQIMLSSISNIAVILFTVLSKLSGIGR